MSEHANPATTEGPSNVVPVLQERGLIAQMTESGLPEAAASGRLYVYCGFDPSKPSLHVGNLVPVMILAHFQRHGHRPILLVGGGTGMIGDPSGKSTERVLLSAQQVAENAERVRKQLAGYLSFEGENGAIMVNNADWLEKMTLIEYLRDIGKHFSVNAMLAKESVRARLEDREQGISYTEFSYMVLQATDFLHLYDAFGCTVQVGGTDQWGNLTAGVDLIRRVRGVRAHALTAELITASSGQKMGKSEGNALYLDPEMTTPYEMYQYWINTDDRDVGRFLKVFTFLPLAEIAAIERRQAEDPAGRVGQRCLAFEITKLIHGEATAWALADTSAALFTEQKKPEERISGLLKDQVFASLADATNDTISASVQTLLESLGQSAAKPFAEAVQPLPPPILPTMFEQLAQSAPPPIAPEALQPPPTISPEVFRRISQGAPPPIPPEVFKRVAETLPTSIPPEMRASAQDALVTIVSNSAHQAFVRLAEALPNPKGTDKDDQKAEADISRIVSDSVRETLDSFGDLIPEDIRSQVMTAAMARSRHIWSNALRAMFDHLAGVVPTVEITTEALQHGVPILDALVMAGAQPSKAAARRLVQQGGLYVNGKRWTDHDAVLSRDNAHFGRAVLLRTGKNKYHLLLANA